VVNQASDRSSARRLYLLSFSFSMVGTGLWMPLNAVFLTEERHMSAAQVGAYYTVMAGTAVLSNLVAGGIADRYGPFRPFVLAATVQGMGIGALLLAHDVPGVFLAAAVSGVGNGAFFATQTAVLVRIFGTSGLTRIFGIQYQIMNVAIAVGAGVLGLMVARLGYAGYVIGFATNAVSYVVHGLNVSGPVRRLAGAAEPSHASPARAKPWAPYLDRAYLPVIMTQLCICLFGYAQLEAVIPVVFRHGTGLPLWAITLLAALNSVVVVVAQPFATRWVERNGHRPGLRLALWCWMASVVPAVVAPHLGPTPLRIAAALAFSAAFALGEVFVSPSMNPMAAAAAPRDRIASYTAAVSLAYSLGLILGPSLLLPVFGVSASLYWGVIVLGCLLGRFALSRTVTRPAPAPVS
jgi:MFS family permease